MTDKKELICDGCGRPESQCMCPEKSVTDKPLPILTKDQIVANLKKEMPEMNWALLPDVTKDFILWTAEYQCTADLSVLTSEVAKREDKISVLEQQVIDVNSSCDILETQVKDLEAALASAKETTAKQEQEKIDIFSELENYQVKVRPSGSKIIYDSNFSYVKKKHLGG